VNRLRNGAFAWARRARNSQKQWFPARVVLLAPATVDAPALAAEMAELRVARHARSAARGALARAACR
jgi:transposase-like protein